MLNQDIKGEQSMWMCCLSLKLACTPILAGVKWCEVFHTIYYSVDYSQSALYHYKYLAQEYAIWDAPAVNAVSHHMLQLATSLLA